MEEADSRSVGSVLGAWAARYVAEGGEPEDPDAADAVPSAGG